MCETSRRLEEGREKMLFHLEPLEWSDQHDLCVVLHSGGAHEQLVVVRVSMYTSGGKD